MRLLLDECVDWRLSRDITNHEVRTARQMGWTALKNGELLFMAAQEFDVFVTVDRNLSFQQDLVSFPIAVIVLRAQTNRLVDLKPLVPLLQAAIDRAPKGTVTVIGWTTASVYDPVGDRARVGGQLLCVVEQQDLGHGKNSL